MARPPRIFTNKCGQRFLKVGKRKINLYIKGELTIDELIRIIRRFVRRKKRRKSKTEKKQLSSIATSGYPLSSSGGVGPLELANIYEGIIQKIETKFGGITEQNRRAIEDLDRARLAITAPEPRLMIEQAPVAEPPGPDPALLLLGRSIVGVTENLQRRLDDKDRADIAHPLRVEVQTDEDEVSRQVAAAVQDQQKLSAQQIAEADAKTIAAIAEQQRIALENKRIYEEKRRREAKDQRRFENFQIRRQAVRRHIIDLITYDNPVTATHGHWKSIPALIRALRTALPDPSILDNMKFERNAAYGDKALQIANAIIDTPGVVAFIDHIAGIRDRTSFEHELNSIRTYSIASFAEKYLRQQAADEKLSAQRDAEARALASTSGAAAATVEQVPSAEGAIATRAAEAVVAAPEGGEPPLESSPVTGIIDPQAPLDASQEGFGRGEGAGLYDSEIDEIMSAIGNHYKGTWASNNFAKMDVTRHDLKDGFCAIINLDKASGPGTHWVAVNFTPDSVEYYDSYGEDPPQRVLDELKKLIDRLRPHTYLKLKINKVIDQRANSSSCGWFAMRFLLDRHAGKPFPEATGYSQITKSEKQIKQMKKKFGYI